uniref:Uncharacterized protein n=1 Tax=Musca domestica TaxID=7370 RepID=A0A1I8MVS2_MUSDO
MATKTIINCLDTQQQSTSVNSVASNQTNSQHQGISIKIDPTASSSGGGPSATGIVIPNYSGPSSAALVSNVIKIQHSCQTTGHGTTLTNLNGNEVASNKTNNNNNTNNNNKLLIDINRKQTTIGDSYGNDDWNPSACLATPTPSSSSLSSSSSSAVIQVKCSTSNPTDFLPLSREMSTEKPLEIAILANGNGNLRESKMESMRDDDDHVVRESHKESGPKSNNFNNESNQTSHTATTTTNTTTTTTITKTTTQQLTSQQVNGNKEENNGHCSLNQTNSKRQTTNGQENQGNDETNFKPHNEDHNEHHYEAGEHNKADHDDHNNDDDDDCGLKFVSGIGKRGDSGLDIIVSHGKRWPAKENSNSLLTQADTATTPQLQSRQATTSVIIGENFYWKKENSQECGENTGKTPPTASAAAHVVKIQINPQNNNNKPITPAPNSAVEKQISVVKIENEELLENHNNENTKENPKESEVNSSEEKNKADQENQKEKSEENEKSRKSELHLNLEKMVQKSQNNVSVTVSSAGGGGSNTNITTPSLAPNSSAGHNSELNVTNPSYLYYSTMSSGQFSPCDTLDSGTGSDLESQNHTPHTPTAHLLLPPSKKPSANGLEMHLKTTKVRVSSSQHGSNKDPRNCNSSSYTDSEESEASSLSCDSLHSSEFMRQSSQSPIQNKIPSPSRKILGSFLPDSLLRDIKNLKLNNTEYEAENENEEDEDHIEQRIKAHKQRQSESYEPISSQDYMMAQNDFVQARNTENSTSTNVAKRASLPSKTFVLNQEDGTFIDIKMNSMPRKYEADKYYNFHVNEHENFRSFGNNNTNNGGNGFSESGSESLAEYDGRNSLNDDVFAGYKDLRCGSATSTIRSNKGTVRGVKNRVRNGIATFLQLQQPNMKVNLDSHRNYCQLYIYTI